MVSVGCIDMNDLKPCIKQKTIINYSVRTKYKSTRILSNYKQKGLIKQWNCIVQNFMFTQPRFIKLNQDFNLLTKKAFVFS